MAGIGALVPTSEIIHVDQLRLDYCDYDYDCMDVIVMIWFRPCVDTVVSRLLNVNI